MNINSHWERGKNRLRVALRIHKILDQRWIVCKLVLFGCLRAVPLYNIIHDNLWILYVIMNFGCTSTRLSFISNDNSMSIGTTELSSHIWWKHMACDFVLLLHIYMYVWVWHVFDATNGTSVLYTVHIVGCLPILNPQIYSAENLVLQVGDVDDSNGRMCS